MTVGDRRVMVIIPTLNEKENLPVLVRGLLEYSSVRILVVDDQSSDGTAEIADELSRDSGGRVEVLHRTSTPGLGRSYIDGIRRAVAEPVDVICQMDADLSHDPRHLPALIGGTDRADVVIGSRYVPGGRVINWPMRRRLLSRFANLYIRLVTRLSARDCTSGYRCWRREALAALAPEHVVSDGYSFLVEMLYVAERRGYTLAETPITFVERRLGSSKLSWKVLLESARTPWRLVARRRLR